MAYRYKTTKINGKTKLLHRHLMEQRLGRELSDDEQVHHRNEDTWDNGDTNLDVLPAAEHRAIHADKRLIHPRQKNCEICGAEFTPHPTKRKRQRTCSPECANRLRSISETATKRALAANYSESRADDETPEFKLVAAE